MKRIAVGIALSPITYIVLVAVLFVGWAHMRAAGEGGEVVGALDRLDLLGTSPVTPGAFAIMIVGWVVARLRQPMFGYVGTAAGVLLLAAMGAYAWQLSDEEVGERLSGAEGSLSPLGRMLRRVDAAREALQDEVDNVKRNCIRLGGGLRKPTISDKDVAYTNPRLKTLYDRLRFHLDEANAELGDERPEDPAAARLRLAESILTNVEGRYRITLGTMLESDTRPAADAGPAETDMAVAASVVRGDALFGVHKWKQALSYYERVFELRPERLSTRFEIANCHFLEGNHDDAFAQYDALVKHLESQAQDGDADLREMLASAINGRANIHYLRRAFESAVDDYDSAGDLYTDLIDRDGRSWLEGHVVGVLNNRGLALFALGRLDQAVLDYDRAVDLRTHSVERQGRADLADTLASVLNNRGLALAGLGRLVDAIEDYDKVVQIRTYLYEEAGAGNAAAGLAAALNHRGLALAGRGKLTQAIQNYERAIRILTEWVEEKEARILAPTLGTVINNKARTLVGLGKFPDAIEVYATAIELREEIVDDDDRDDLEHDLAESLNDRGIAYSYGRMYDRALADYDRALEIYARMHDADGRQDLTYAYASALANRGLTLADLQRRPDAVRDYGRAIQLYRDLVTNRGQSGVARDLANTLNNRGLAYADMTQLGPAMRDYDEAVTMLEKQVEAGQAAMRNHLARALTNRANALFLGAKLDDATSDINRAIEIRTRLLEDEDQKHVANDLAQSLLSRGYLSVRRNDIRQAVTDLERAFELARAPQLKRQLSQILKDLRGR